MVKKTEGILGVNIAVHYADSKIEMVHAMNNIRDHIQKSMWQALFTYISNLKGNGK
jgi:hypothetical protein